MTPTTNPEHALLGAVLCQQSADGAVQVLTLFHDDDLGDPRLQVVADIVRGLAEAGVPCDPTTVLAAARATGTVTSPEAIQGFAVLLTELVTGCPVPASWRYYLVGVLDESLRRRAAMLATRIGQAAEHDSVDSLLSLIGREVVAVGEVEKRRAAAEEVA